MGFPSLVYTHGWVLALWIASYMLVPLVGMGLLGKRVNRLARQSGAVTIPDLIKARFRSESVGMIATLLVLFFMFFYLLAQFKAGSKIMTTLLQDVAIYQSAVNAVGGAIDGLPWIGSAEPDYVLCLLVFAFSVIVYTAFGGFRAVVWTDVMQGIVMGVGVIILLYLTLGQVGGLTKATEQLKEMTPPETGIGIVTLGQAHTETTTLPKGDWLRLSDGGIARLAEQASLAKGETRTEAKLLKITTPAEVDRIEPTDFGFTVTATFTADETKGYGRGLKGVYVSAPGPHPEREDGFLNVWVAISFFFFWAFGSAGQPSNMVRLMAFKGTNVLRNAILAVSVYYTVIYLLLVVMRSHPAARHGGGLGPHHAGARRQGHRRRRRAVAGRAAARGTVCRRDVQRGQLSADGLVRRGPGYLPKPCEPQRQRKAAETPLLPRHGGGRDTGHARRGQPASIPAGFDRVCHQRLGGLFPDAGAAWTLLAANDRQGSHRRDVGRFGLPPLTLHRRILERGQIRCLPTTGIQPLHLVPNRVRTPRLAGIAWSNESTKKLRINLIQHQQITPSDLRPSE